GNEKQAVAAIADGQECPHDTRIVLVGIGDRLVVLLLERRNVSLPAQRLQHLPQRIVGRAGKDALFVAVFVASAMLGVKWIAVEEGKQRNLLTLGLKLSGHGVSHEAAERPTEQILGPDRLNLSNEPQIVRRHVLDGIGEGAVLSEIARLESIDRMIRRDVTDEP